MSGTRIYDGFSTLEKGMNGAFAPSLIPINQCAAAKDFTFRDGYVRTRPPWANLILSFDSETTKSRFTGKFQGACFYDSEFGTDGFVLSVGGRLFRLELGLNNVISEITPRITIVTIEDFTVPAPASTVTVETNSASLIAFGDTVYIDSGQYTVTSISGNELLLTYVAGAANAVALSGNSVLDAAQALIVEFQTNPADYDFIYTFQAENYTITLAGQHRPIIFDGSNARRAATDEIPPGIFGIYLWGRIWIVQNDLRSLVAGDLIGGPSGTAALGFRDAILKMTENDFLNEGGSFTVPHNAGSITALGALATQDTSLGVGNLLVGTTNSVVSINTPVDRTTWKNLTYPIQTISLIDYGPRGQRSTVGVNGDLWYRSIDGIRSFIVARRALGTPGNTPMSREIDNVLKFDDPNMLVYGSGELFDNRLLMTVSPRRTPYGITHKGLSVINYDLLSSMDGKSAPAWEGVYTGLDIFQVVKGNFNDKERCFSFVNNNGTIEFWEFLKTGYYDQFSSVTDGITTIDRRAIQPWLETRSYNFGDSSQRKSLYTCEIFLDELVDNVTLTIKYRSDQYPGWTDWATVNLCATVTQCTPPTPGQFQCQIFKTKGRQYAARLLLPRPVESCNPLSSRQMFEGYEFQFRIEGTGYFRLRRFKPHAIPMDDVNEGVCQTGDVPCQSIDDCGTDWFNYSSRTVSL